nr:HAD family hydrolase [Bacteriovorax sp. HI3]
MNKTIKLLIFDLDGTLVDSHQDILNAVNRTLEHFNAPAVSANEAKSFIGSGIFNFIIQRLLEKGIRDFERAAEVYRKNYAECMLENTSVYESVFEMLQSFSDYKKVVLTNKSNEFVGVILEELELSNYFLNFYGKETFEKHKPDPLPIFKISDEFNVSIENILIIGDTEADILAGKNASVRTVGVSYGYGDPSRLKEMQADYIIDHPNELATILH